MTKIKKSPVNKLILTATTRQIFGKKLKKLRRQGQIPANIYGQDFKSQAVSVDFKEFIKIYRQVKETGVLYLKLNKEEIPVLIHNVQRHPVKDTYLHIDFRKVDLTKEIETAVPIKIVGHSEAVDQKGGVLLTQTNELMIKARPENLPPQIEIDISRLKEIDQEIKVADLPPSSSYQIIDPPEKTIVLVVAHKEEAVVPETTTVAPEIITEKKEEETTKTPPPEKTETKQTTTQPSPPPPKNPQKK